MPPAVAMGIAPGIRVLRTDFLVMPAVYVYDHYRAAAAK